MADFSFRGQSLDNDLVGSISSLLNDAGIPNLLWGNYLLTIYGVPTIVDGVSFIVPDALIEPGLSTLLHSGFLPCTPSFECPHSNDAKGFSTNAHLHINEELVISLYGKSDMLWELPDFDIATQNTDIMSASDPQLPPTILGRGQGRFPSHLSAVRIPSAVRYCEAILFLLCRDYGHLREYYWMAMLTYLMEYVDGTDILREESLREEYTPFYGAIIQGDPDMWLHLDTLRDGLIRRQAIR
ncbi:hypothetical protein P170DRAFT_369818 [Aspergillus steynii IBT 23096]|uniref:Thioredoxin reductase n=1 Tax=Aspergillus steynii IBT 23096 TaxID=1392250 RepID=A0A2I2FRC7_9EURO|nr:uncharacterized protein P170DRAFT_369818 [Aspergillus steynii IBT 23096]PLB43194.1 hypothetical protein P170DRAFT_369818 [Aspergillus steynii IBT 23096]